MTLKVGTRAQETTTTTGTGALSLAGATAQCQSIISAIGNGGWAKYLLLSGNGTDWEQGYGYVTSGSPNTWTRQVVLKSTNSNAAISLSGTSTITLLRAAADIAGMGENFSPGPPIPALASWTQVSITGLTSVVQNKRTITIKDTGTNVFCLRGLSIAAPTAPYRVAVGLKYSGVLTQWPGILAGFTDGTKFDLLDWNYQNVEYENWSSSTTRAVGSASSKVPSAPLETSMQWTGLRDDGTNYYLEWSLDSVNWTTLQSGAKSGGYLGATGYSRLFWGLNPDHTNPTAVTLLCWDTNGLNRSMP